MNGAGDNVLLMRRLATGILALTVLAPPVSNGQEIEISVDPDAVRRATHVPLAICVPESLAGIPGGPYAETATTETGRCEAQISLLGPWGCEPTPGSPSGRWMALSVPKVPRASTITLVPGSADTPFSWAEDGTTLHLSESGMRVFGFNFGMMLKEGVPEDRRRACYFHPVYDLDGNMITDDFPDDHHHHRGMAWMWPGVWYGERQVDEWHIKGVRQEFVRWLGREAGPVCAVIGIEAGWFLDDGTRMAEEVSWYRVFRKSDQGRAIDVHYTLKALDQPVKIQGTLADEKGYGGFCFRFGPRTDTVITTPEGRATKDSNRIPYPWVDFSARFAGSDSHSGAAIFVHPSHPGYPNGWTIRHYGFLGVAWPGLEIVTLDPGESFTLQYRVWIHRGDAEGGKVEEAWNEFIEPPEPVADLPHDE